MTHSDLSDPVIEMEGISIYRKDRTESSGDSQCTYTAVTVLAQSCSPDFEGLLIKCHLFYLPRKYSSTILLAVFIPSQANAETVLDKLHLLVNSLETANLDALFIIAGDFIQANLQNVLPKYHHQISCPMWTANYSAPPSSTPITPSLTLILSKLIGYQCFFLSA